MYVSVWTGCVKHYSHCGRVVLRYDTKTGVLTCPCSKSKRCIHVKLARLHLTVNKPSLPVCITDTEDDNEHDEQGEHPSVTCPTPESSFPTFDSINRHVDYLLGKKIPVDISPHLSDGIPLPSAIVPREDKCPLCSTAPSLITTLVSGAGRIYDLDTVKEGTNNSLPNLKNK